MRRVKQQWAVKGGAPQQGKEDRGLISAHLDAWEDWNKGLYVIFPYMASMNLRILAHNFQSNKNSFTIREKDAFGIVAGLIT